jgi:aspartyl-tRNA synthetase
VARVCRDVADIAVQTPFPRLAFNEALDRFGTDKPDLRYGLELTDISDIAGASECNVFKAALAGGGQVKGLRAPGCAGWSRREIDELTRFAVAHKAPGLAYIVISPEGIRSPIAKFFSQGQLEALVDRLGGQPGDVLLFVAGKPEVVAAALDFLRRHLAERLGLIPPNTFAFTWITDFPMLPLMTQKSGMWPCITRSPRPTKPALPSLKRIPSRFVLRRMIWY